MTLRSDTTGHQKAQLEEVGRRLQAGTLTWREAVAMRDRVMAGETVITPTPKPARPTRPSERTVLDTLTRHGALTAREVTDRTGVPRYTVNEALRRLKAAGRVRRHARGGNQYQPGTYSPVGAVSAPQFGAPQGGRQ